jgi:hypothetical protein
MVKDYFLTIFHRNRASVACMSFKVLFDLFKPSITYFLEIGTFILEY